MVRLTDRPDMNLDVDRGLKTTTQQQQQQLLKNVDLLKLFRDYVHTIVLYLCYLCMGSQGYKFTIFLKKDNFCLPG